MRFPSKFIIETAHDLFGIQIIYTNGINFHVYHRRGDNLTLSIMNNKNNEICDRISLSKIHANIYEKFFQQLSTISFYRIVSSSIDKLRSNSPYTFEITLFEMTREQVRVLAFKVESLYEALRQKTITTGDMENSTTLAVLSAISLQFSVYAETYQFRTMILRINQIQTRVGQSKVLGRTNEPDEKSSLSSENV